MSLMLQVQPARRPRVQLQKDLVREVKRGHAWLFSNAVGSLDVPSGTLVDLYDKKGEKQLAVGLYDPEHPIRLRVLSTQPPFVIDEDSLAARLEQALALRACFFDRTTTGQRWIAGEGDALPGLIVDRYADVAVIKVDGGAVAEFYDVEGVARWLAANGISSVIERVRERGVPGRFLIGGPESLVDNSKVEFLENGMRFWADVLQGQKTGFFLDQRDNRDVVRRLATKKSVLNLYSFSGGFSVAAGLGGAAHVTSVDIAAAAIQDANAHWLLNDLDPSGHEGVAEDCFEYLSKAEKQKRKWDMVIIDPPSFAPNERSRANASGAYERLARLGSQVTNRDGLLAFASCSSHIGAAEFRRIAETGLGKQRRRATLLTSRGLPLDHPTPLAMPELRYLKFLLFRLD